MALSGSYDFTRTRDQLITLAMEEIGILGEGETPNASQVDLGSRRLNVMLKAWQNQDIGLWLQQEATLFLDKTSQSYSIGPSGGHCTTSYTKTEIKTAAVSGATSIDVDSTTGMAASDNVGVEQDDGTLHWTTVSSVTDSDTFVLTNGLTAAAAVDRNVYFYTNKIQRPVSIDSADVRLQYDDGTEHPIWLISRNEYMRQTDKATSGKPVQAYYQPTLTNGTLFVWPVSDSVVNQIQFSCKVNIQDLDAATDNFEVPPQWLQAVMYGLALELSGPYGVPADVVEYIGGDRGRLAQAMGRAMEGDDDGASFQMAVYEED